MFLVLQLDIYAYQFPHVPRIVEPALMFELIEFRMFFREVWNLADQYPMWAYFYMKCLQFSYFSWIQIGIAHQIIVTWIILRNDNHFASTIFSKNKSSNKITFWKFVSISFSSSALIISVKWSIRVSSQVFFWLIFCTKRNQNRTQILHKTSKNNSSIQLKFQNELRVNSNLKP